MADKLTLHITRTDCISCSVPYGFQYLFRDNRISRQSSLDLDDNARSRLRPCTWSNGSRTETACVKLNININALGEIVKLNNQMLPSRK